MTKRYEQEHNGTHYEQWLKNEFVELIISGTKTFEIRPADDYLGECQPGDTITFKSQNNEVAVKVAKKTLYENLEAYLNTDPNFQSMVGQKMNREQALRLWSTLYKSHAYGPIVVIEIEQT